MCKLSTNFALILFFYIASTVWITESFVGSGTTTRPNPSDAAFPGLASLWDSCRCAGAVPIDVRSLTHEQTWGISHDFSIGDVSFPEGCRYRTNWCILIYIAVLSLLTMILWFTRKVGKRLVFFGWMVSNFLVYIWRHVLKSWRP